MTGEEAYEKYSDELIRFATSLVGPADAADVVAEAVVRCMYRKDWSEVQSPRAYLHRAVLSEASNHHRRTLRRRVREAATAPPETIATVDVDPDVLRAVARLSMRQRAVVFLTYWSDLEPATVAALLGIGEGSVRKHLARARARLRKLLDD